MKAWKLKIILTWVIAVMAIGAIVCGVYFGVRQGKFEKIGRECRNNM